MLKSLLVSGIRHIRALQLTVAAMPVTERKAVTGCSMLVKRLAVAELMLRNGAEPGVVSARKLYFEGVMRIAASNCLFIVINAFVNCVTLTLGKDVSAGFGSIDT
jgi:hypothetical protein